MTTEASPCGSAACPRCGTKLFHPDWSENVGPQSVVNIWCCSACGNEFETTDKGVVSTLSKAELERVFFANLLVA